MFFVFLYMTKKLTLLFTLLSFYLVKSQNISLPEDLRQHNLTEYNSSLFNPAFSLTRNKPQSIALWSRWQWQTIDADPSTLFLNFTSKWTNESALGAGFFQHNTGLYLNTGGVLNYAYSLEFSEKVKLGFGINLFGYNKSVVDEALLLTPLPDDSGLNDFVMQFAPGIFLTAGNFGIGITSENLLDYNFTAKNRDSSPEDRIYTGMVSYGFSIGSNNAILRPMVYAKSIPNNDTQVGGNLIFTAEKFWLQGGYNSFYGVSGGGGIRLLKKLSLGTLVEYGTNTGFEDIEPTFEIYASYFLKSQVFEEEKEEEEILSQEEEKAKEELESEDEFSKKELKAIEKAEKKALKAARKKGKLSKKELAEQERLAAEQQAKEEEERMTLEAEKRMEEQRLEAIKAEEEKQARALAIKKEEEELAKIKAADELARQQVNEKVEVQAGEKYQEVTNEDGLEPGFYLIANVFGTKKYFNAFMNDLRNKGMKPKSFYRSKNNYNYAYLERYDTIGEARRARDNNFNGRYQENTWIFRVK